MAVSITAGTQRNYVGDQLVQTLTNSTATAAQAISAKYTVTTISGGTATGTQLRNVYTMPSGPDGLIKWVQMIATGEATVNMTMSTGLHALGSTSSDAVYMVGAATGGWVLSAKTDYIFAQFLDEGWTILGTNATLATST